MKLKLYHARWSLCSQMVRVALAEKGLSYESKLIKLCDQYPEAENLSPEYLAINPKGIVPSFCLLYTSPSPRDATLSRMPSSA